MGAKQCLVTQPWYNVLSYWQEGIRSNVSEQVQAEPEGCPSPGKLSMTPGADPFQHRPVVR